MSDTDGPMLLLLSEEVLDPLWDWEELEVFAVMMEFLWWLLKSVGKKSHFLFIVKAWLTMDLQTSRLRCLSVPISIRAELKRPLDPTTVRISEHTKLTEHLTWYLRVQLVLTCRSTGRCATEYKRSLSSHNGRRRWKNLRETKKEHIRSLDRSTIT